MTVCSKQVQNGVEDNSSRALKNDISFAHSWHLEAHLKYTKPCGLNFYLSMKRILFVYSFNVQMGILAECKLCSSAASSPCKNNMLVS